MKTIFIINPKSGNKRRKCLIDCIKRTIENIDADASLYYTKAPKDAFYFVKNYCETFGAARFIACGGDGTLSEVVNACANTEEAEVGVIPVGTGNDFSRNFPHASFENIEAQIISDTVPCDIIKYTTYTEDEIKTGYAVNMVNIGFDCSVADLTNTLKRTSFLSGSFSYFLSIMICFIKKKGARVKVIADGIETCNENILLNSIANGSYCGGGIKSNPLAVVNDGFLNYNIVKDISRLKFISLLPGYMKGTLTDKKGIEHIFTSEKCLKLVVIPKDDGFKIGVDGEIIDAGKTEFEIIHNAINFVLPKTENVQAVSPEKNLV